MLAGVEHLADVYRLGGHHGHRYLRSTVQVERTNLGGRNLEAAQGRHDRPYI